MDALAFVLLEPGPELRTGQSEYEKEPGGGQKAHLEPALAGGRIGHQLGDELRIAEPGNPLAPGPEIERVRHEEQRNKQQEQQILTLCQINHYGILLKITKRSSSSASRAKSAISAKRMNSSE